MGGREREGGRGEGGREGWREGGREGGGRGREEGREGGGREEGGREELEYKDAMGLWLTGAHLVRSPQDFSSSAWNVVAKIGTLFIRGNK